MPWQVTMVICLAVGFGCFGYAIYLMMQAEERKRGASKAP